jgi:predicted transcriptional regulator of viral defense system
MALDRGYARPRIKYPPLRIMRYSGEAFSEGIKIHRIKGVDCKIYSVAKTVADCFKYRNKIGLDVAIEALRESLKEKKCTMNELWEFSKICRVEKIMRPYMEAII